MFLVDVSPYLFVFNILAGAAAGALCGLVPLAMALYRQRKVEAGILLFLCTLSGLVLGFWTAIPAAAAAGVFVRRHDATCEMMQRGFVQADGTFSAHPDRKPL